LDLFLRAFVARAGGEDLQHEPVAVDHARADGHQPPEVAVLAGGEFAVEDDCVGVRLLDPFCERLRFPATEVVRAVLAAALGDRVDHLEPRGGREASDLSGVRCCVVLAGGHHGTPTTESVTWLHSCRRRHADSRGDDRATTRATGDRSLVVRHEPRADCHRSHHSDERVPADALTGASRIRSPFCLSCSTPQL
jgi:hypothetical protein